MNPGAARADDTAAQPLRSDAERNRARILAAARRVFGADGLNASMASVAGEAGVGIATLFRRFPPRRIWSRPCSPTAWTPTPTWPPRPSTTSTSPMTIGIIESVCAMQAADDGFADVLTMTFPTAKALEERRLEVYHSVVQLIDRAKAAGRPAGLLLHARGPRARVHGECWAPPNATGEDVPDAWRRVVTLMIQSFEVLPAAPARIPPEPTRSTRAMLRAGQGKLRLAQTEEEQQLGSCGTGIQVAHVAIDVALGGVSMDPTLRAATPRPASVSTSGTCTPPSAARPRSSTGARPRRLRAALGDAGSTASSAARARCPRR